ncbi:HAD family phosphatase [Enterococcus sp. ALS3]|uniref:HAD family phosphatase n=1 Tax=Enterococcus alishanensis TaxID=1303817 RepID=A0ABS6TE72_9ENTE|nr:HAD family phosphatase [Enterococcus alishanensis]MBV7391219.1 HAD family phosphatase [Enterococcus alishanensis]
MEKVELLIFDMDGLMFETGRLAYRSYLKSAEKYDYEMNHNVYYYLTGRVEEAILNEMGNLYGEEVPYPEWREEMKASKNRVFAAEKRVFKKKGLENLLKYAKDSQRMVAVASSNFLHNIEEYLEIEGVIQYIDFIISGDEVTNGKPDPEIFLKACEKANVSPENAVVLEDSRVGIKAAKAAKIRAFLVEDEITDLPINMGKYKLLMDLSQSLAYEVKPDVSFKDLDEVVDYLKNEKI